MANADSPRPPAARSGSGKGRTRTRRGAPDGGGGTPNLGLLRHQARTLALQVLFEIELTGHDVRDALTHAFSGPDDPREDADGDGGVPAVPPDVQGYAERLVHGTLLHLYRIDPILTAAAPNFADERTPTVDRNVLRMAAYEVIYQPDIPPKVAVNEAVELAKHFGGDNSGRFVNGVLRTVVARVEAGAAAEPDPAGG